MLTYTVDFISRNIIDGTPVVMRGNNLKSDSLVQPSSSPRSDRSTGSPDSLRSESSSDSSISTSHLLQTLGKKAAIVTNGSKMDKPLQSYIALISMAILSSKENKMVLGDIYQFIMDKFQFYNNEQKAWRNSIRHNLSINECFIKNGRFENGKGHFWSIHPACVADFAKGDFRRRQARRRVRKQEKDCSKSYRPVNGLQYNQVYTPMVQSPLGHHPMSSSLIPQPKLSAVGYQPMTAPPVGYQPRASSPVGYEPMTSPPIGYQPLKTPPPVGYQQMTSTPIGNFPFLSIIPGHQPTSSVSQGYFPYQENNQVSYAQTRIGNTSQSTTYLSPTKMSPFDGFPFTLPYSMH